MRGVSFLTAQLEGKRVFLLRNSCLKRCRCDPGGGARPGQTADLAQASVRSPAGAVRRPVGGRHTAAPRFQIVWRGALPAPTQRGRCRFVPFSFDTSALRSNALCATACEYVCMLVCWCVRMRVCKCVRAFVVCPVRRPDAVT